jgi:hypothetical protein
MARSSSSSRAATDAVRSGASWSSLWSRPRRSARATASMRLFTATVGVWLFMPHVTALPS